MYIYYTTPGIINITVYVRGEYTTPNKKNKENNKNQNCKSKTCQTGLHRGG